MIFNHNDDRSYRYYAASARARGAECSVRAYGTDVVFRNVFRNHGVKLAAAAVGSLVVKGARGGVGGAVCAVFKDHPPRRVGRAGPRVAKRRGPGDWPTRDRGAGPPPAGAFRPNVNNNQPSGRRRRRRRHAASLHTHRAGE